MAEEPPVKRKPGRPRKNPTPVAAPVEAAPPAENLVDDDGHPPPELIRWRNVDDPLLIIGMQQVGDIVTVYHATKFSRTYSLREVKERWKMLLYDKSGSKRAVERMARMERESHHMMTPNVLWSAPEEELLRTIQQDEPGVEAFEALRAANLAVFHPSRTAHKMRNHWALMQYYGHHDVISMPSKRRRARTTSQGEAVPDAKTPTGIPADGSIGLEELEHQIMSAALDLAKRPLTAIDEAEREMKQELLRADRAAKRKIRRLEEETASWSWSILPPVPAPQPHALPANPVMPLAGRPLMAAGTHAGMLPSHASAGSGQGRVESYAFDMSILAMLKGTKLRYPMRTREIVLGRSECDVNLQEEGPASRVSRKQAIIKMKGNAEFYLKNIGRRAMYVNGKPVCSGEKTKLFHTAIIEVDHLRFMFSINLVLQKKLLNVIKS